MNNGPFLTVVIANYNYGQYLTAAIESVFAQLCSDYELIVVDGGSKDDSVEAIRRCAGSELSVDGNWHRCEKLTWISEKDRGQSDAFNKGFARARGKFLTWLNADDLMLDGAIEMLKKASEKYPSQEWFAAGSVHFNYDGRVVRCARTRRFSEYEVNHGSITVYSPSSFFSRRLYEAVGGMDEFFKYSMDTHLWGRFYKREHVRFKVLPGYVFGFRYHPLSKTACGYFESIKTPEQTAADNAQGAAERVRIRELLQPKGQISNVVRLLKMDWSAKIRSLIDTVRYRGKMIADCRFNG